MATQVLDLASVSEGAAKVSLVYNNTLLQITGFQIVNTLNRLVVLTVGTALLGSSVFTIGAKTSLTISLPSSISFTRGSRIAKAGINLTMGFGTA